MRSWTGGLRDGSLQPVLPEDDDTDDEEASAPEGRVLYRRHRTRERNEGLRKKKIGSVLKNGSKLACEACGFDFGKVYGDRGKGYIECHHEVPLHEAGEGTTKLADLALICSNCHRDSPQRAVAHTGRTPGAGAGAGQQCGSLPPWPAFQHSGRRSCNARTVVQPTGWPASSSPV